MGERRGTFDAGGKFHDSAFDYWIAKGDPTTRKSRSATPTANGLGVASMAVAARQAVACGPLGKLRDEGRGCLGQHFGARSRRNAVAVGLIETIDRGPGLVGFQSDPGGWSEGMVKTVTNAGATLAHLTSASQLRNGGPKPPCCGRENRVKGRLVATETKSDRRDPASHQAGPSV